MSLGKGHMYSSSTRQRLNTRSSTEAELVGVDDAMTGVIWTRNFLEHQGINITDNVVYQDNQSAILLENNGAASSGKRTRHLDVRYFFVCDRIGSGEMRVEYCPTGDMVADILTKPLQGSLFRKFRAALLNIDYHDPGAPSQECVETGYSHQGSDKSDHGDDVVPDTTEENDVDLGEWKIVERKKYKARNSVGMLDEDQHAHTRSRI
jgi:hypothetical protein